uniref:CSON004722 protein n=1 Tax=Culicoides sonorensis TaxID=179676 RepID=A0A336MY57_CULSO
MQPSRMFVQRLANFTARRGYQTKHYRQVTMNDLPVPQGDFFELEAARNRKYNAILAAGLSLTLGALFLAKTTGLIELHMDPPKSLD